MTTRTLELSAILSVFGFVGVVGCLASAKDRGEALAEGIAWVRVGCGEYLRDERIPRHPDATELCPIVVGQPVSPPYRLSTAEDVARSVAAPDVPPSQPDSGTSGAGGSISTTPGNAVRAADGG